MSQLNQQDFLRLLEQEAQYQSILNKKSLLPHQLDGLASFVARHTWQVITIMAAASALIVEIGKRL